MQRKTRLEVWTEYVIRTLRQFSSLLSTQGSNINKVIGTNGTKLIWTNAGSSLPDQSGNIGKYLTTNGDTASWVNIRIDSVQPMSIDFTNPYTIIFDEGTIVDLFLNANNINLGLQSSQLGTFIVKIKNSASVSRTITWDGNIKWPANNPPVITPIANKTDVLTFVYDGSNWFGSYVLNYNA